MTFWGALLLFVLQSVPLPGSLQGVVHDQSGAIVPGAEVRVLQADGTTIATAITDGNGVYTFDALRPGTYQVRVAVEGFRPAAARVTIAPGRRSSAPRLVLAVATLEQQLTVGGGPEMSTSSAGNRDAVVMSGSDLKDIPAFDKDVIGTLSRFLDAGAVDSGGVTLVVDGMEARKTGVSPSAIQQISINQDPYAAEFQRPGRGRIEVITKAGSDSYHGVAAFTFRDASLNARDAFADVKPPEQRRIYEGVVGGPLVNGKTTSFLLTLDRREEDLQSIVFAQTPDGRFHDVVPRPSRGLEGSGSVTHQFAMTQTLSVRGTVEAQTTKNAGVGGINLPELASRNASDEEQVVIGHRWVKSKSVLHESRLLVGREIQRISSLVSAPRVVVLDAFARGGAQNDEGTSEYHFQWTDALTYARGRSVWKVGVSIPDFSRRGFADETNRLGTFTFASLDDYANGRPLSFTRQSGDGSLVFLQKVFGAFVQDQIRLSPRLSLGLGVRYDWQNVFADANNFAPRASVAFAPGGGTVIRGGAGVFYDRAGDGALHDVLRSQEARLTRTLVLSPGYPNPFAGAAAGAPVPRSIVVLNRSLATPYTVQFSGTVEKQVRKKTTIAVGYTGARGVDLFRSIDINAPPPPLYSTRPDPAHAQIREIQSAGRQLTHSLQLTARGVLGPRLRGTAQYTLSSAHNDTNGINYLPANNYDPAAEYGRADFDQRQRVDLVAQVNGGEWMKFAAAVTLTSGRPYSLRTGTDDYHTGQTNARPAGVGRNTLEGPGYASVDLKWSHAFSFRDGGGDDDAPGVEVSVDAFNVANRVNYAGFVGNMSSPFFGQAIAAQPPRRVQLSVEFHF